VGGPKQTQPPTTHTPPPPPHPPPPHHPKQPHPHPPHGNRRFRQGAKAAHATGILWSTKIERTPRPHHRNVISPNEAGSRRIRKGPLWRPSFKIVGTSAVAFQGRAKPRRGQQDHGQGRDVGGWLKGIQGFRPRRLTQSSSILGAADGTIKKFLSGNQGGSRGPLFQTTQATPKSEGVVVATQGKLRGQAKPALTFINYQGFVNG